MPFISVVDQGKLVVHFSSSGESIWLLKRDFIARKISKTGRNRKRGSVEKVPTIVAVCPSRKKPTVRSYAQPAAVVEVRIPPVSF